MWTGDVERIRAALQFIPAHDRDTWLRAGMGIKAELGDAGFELWDTWSQQDDSYDRQAAKDVWKSITPTGRVTVGTVFHLAQANGWRDDGVTRVPTPEELADRRRTVAERTAKAEAEIAHARDQTAKLATAILSVATQAKPDHAYLRRKNVAAVATLREIDADKAAAILGYPPKCKGSVLEGRLLVAPVTVDCRISTLELIDGTGRKAALAGRGTKGGGYWAARPLPDGAGDDVTLLIGEGVATVLSAIEATGHTGIAALSAGNLSAVAEIMRERYPAADIVVLADLVKETGEPDHRAAEAARVAGGKLAVPAFGPSRPPSAKDFNDMAQVCGATAVLNAIAAAEDLPMVLEPQKKSDTRGRRNTTVELVRASDIRPEAVDWIWDGFIPAGKLVVLGGAPGTGKTTIAMQLASVVTVGGRWPDGTRAPIGNVVIWSGEDDPNDTLVPRLAVAGADLHRVQIIRSVLEDGQRRPFDPAQDLAALKKAMPHVGDARLLVVDPIVSAVAGDSHKNAEVRRALQPLVDLAAESRCALLGITHFTKGTAGREPVERLTGSLAFGALARVVLVAAKQQGEGDDRNETRVFVRAKSNLGPDGGGFEYELHRAAMREHPGIFASVVHWGRRVEGSARSLLAEAETVTGTGTEVNSERDEAKEFLVDLLTGGPVEVTAVKRDAVGAGHSWSTVRRAQKALGIKPRKNGMQGGWLWELPRRCSPEPEGAQHEMVSTFGGIEHLHDGKGLVEVEI